MRIKWDVMLTGTLVACALVTTGLVVHREFFAVAPATPAAAPEQKPVFIEGWRAHLGQGERFGPANAPVQLIEFADFECPFCATSHKTLQALRARYPREVALTYMHFPLAMHRFAEPAVRVAECAGKQARFEPMADRLYEQQNQLGLKPWSEFAAEAGVADGAAFEACIESTEPIPRLVAGQQLGERLGVQGTPTLILNGWKLARPPNDRELDRMVKAVLAGKSPVSAR